MKNKTLYLPALRCRIGDWIYYLTSMQMQEVSIRVRPVTDMHTHASLNELLQREITDRKRDIAHYLIGHSQRFFNSIVVGVYGGSPQWVDLAIDPKTITSEEISDEDAERINQTIGLLYLSGTELLFAVDGQHRVEGIREALNSKIELSKEEIGVIFVAHSRDQDGLSRTRRLFSTLNRYAKPVSQGEIVALDEDDAFAIVTRRLMDEHPLLRNDRAYAYKQVSLPSSDKKNFTSMLSVYKISIILCDGLHKNWVKKDLMTRRPPDITLEDIYSVCSAFWSCMATSFTEIGHVREDSASVTGLYRRDDGGHMLFRPVGQMAFARAVRMLNDEGMSTQAAVQALSGVPYELSADPWPGILWNSAAKTMITSILNQKLAAKILLYYIGRLDASEALQEYRNVLANTEAKLPHIDIVSIR